MKLRFSLTPQVSFRVYFTEKMEEHFDETDESDYIYSGYTILYYIGASRRPEIPSTLGGVPVRVIECTAFAGNTNIEAVKIPEGVEVIE